MALLGDFVQGMRAGGVFKCFRPYSIAIVKYQTSDILCGGIVWKRSRGESHIVSHIGLLNITVPERSVVGMKCCIESVVLW